jgi:hypothetical protein
MWLSWAKEVNVWMHNHLEQLTGENGELPLSLMEAMWFYQLELPERMGIADDPDLAAPLFVAAYAAGESTPRFVAVVDRVPMADTVEFGRRPARLELPSMFEGGSRSTLKDTVSRLSRLHAALEAVESRAVEESPGPGSEQAELTAGILEALVWEPAANRSPPARRTDLAALDAWLLDEMHCTYMMQTKSFREVGVGLHDTGRDSDI